MAVISRFPGCLGEGQFVEGANALTFPVGDAPAAAACVARLHRDRALLRRLSSGARRSQAGVNSSAGALEAWAAALALAQRLPQRSEPGLPALPAPAGRLQRWGLPERFAEGLRRLAGRRAFHADAGSEWPHHGGLASPPELARIAAFAAEDEAGLSPRPPGGP